MAFWIIWNILKEIFKNIKNTIKQENPDQHVRGIKISLKYCMYS